MESQEAFEDETELVRESGINFYYQIGLLTEEEALKLLNTPYAR